MNLSDRQKHILQFIKHFLDDKNFPPSIREIGQAVGITSTSVVKYNLNKLERDELIVREKEVSRGLSLNWEKIYQSGLGSLFSGSSGHESNGTALNGSYNPVGIPILGPIVAGYPIEVVPADRETAEDWIELNSSLFRQTDDLYALRVQGDSMIDASVLDGDIVILRHQEEAKNGEMVAAWIDGDNETTLKYFHLKGNMVELTPANPAFEVITRPAAQVRVVGKVVSVIRTLE